MIFTHGGIYFLSYDVIRGKNYNSLINIEGKIYVERLPITKAAYIEILQQFCLRKKKLGRRKNIAKLKAKT